MKTKVSALQHCNREENVWEKCTAEQGKMQKAYFKIKQKGGILVLFSRERQGRKKQNGRSVLKVHR